MTEHCRRCGDAHNPWMPCTTALVLRARGRPGWCERCGHEHSGPGMAGICIGCACGWRPGVPDVPDQEGRSVGACDLRTLPLFDGPGAA